MNFITREKIKNIKSIAGDPFPIPQWEGNCVNIIKWSGKQRAELLVKVSSMYDDNMVMNADSTIKTVVDPAKLPMMNKLMAEIVATSICDENGILIYNPKSPEDIDEVECMDGEVLQTLFMECAKRNGLLEVQLKEEIKN